MNIAAKEFQQNAMQSAIQIGAVFLILLLCFQIVRPFITLVVWALIIAVALYPVHLGLAAKLGGRQKLSATIFVLVGLAILLVPSIQLAESSIESLRNLGEQLNSGSVNVPPPDPSVADWPLVGEQVHAIWSGAASNLEATLNRYDEQLKAFGKWLVGFIGGLTLGILQFVGSLIIAGVFLVSAEGGYRVARSIGHSLSEENGAEMIDMSVQTIRSVAKGVLGVAFVQALLSAIGLVLMGVPAAGVWTLLVLVLAIIQLPPILVMGPIAIWVFSVADTTPATIFFVYAMIVSGSDAFLKPMFLGRGMQIPMLVILLGAIGGAMAIGIIGLFVGAIVLAVGYQLLTAWMRDEEAEAIAEAAAESGST